MSAVRRTALVRPARVPFVDRALGWQTVHAVSDGMIYVLLALELNIVVGYPAADIGVRAFSRSAPTRWGAQLPVLGSPALRALWSFWLCIWLAAAVTLLGVVIARRRCASRDYWPHPLGREITRCPASLGRQAGESHAHVGRQRGVAGRP